MKKWVYTFEEGSASMRDLLGGKGANLAEMTRMGIRVPPGFTITTEACREYLASGRLPEGLWEQVREGMSYIEGKMGRRFGDPREPLLVSVRSGAPVSMPGMMDTILNLGLNDEAVEGLARMTGNPRFAWDSYRRFIQMFGSIVMGVPKEAFDEAFEAVKRERGAEQDIDLDAEGMREVAIRFKRIYEEHVGSPFPQDPWEQLRLAIEAVFRSWNNRRAIEYRRIHGIPDTLCTAVNVVAMVFGNLGMDSGTGVVFTRNPATGEKGLFGEFLPNAQGEDVVAGIRTPYPIEKLKEVMPEVYEELEDVAERLERHFRDMQDIEFTVERGTLYILQTRNGKRTAQAAVKIAVDMAKEGLISREEAVLRVRPEDVTAVMHPRVDPRAEKRVIAKGLAASPGAAVGKIVFDPERAVQLARKGEKVILVRPETSPEDIGGMAAAQGILTSRGGMTSHAAVVARAMGKPAVVGSGVAIDLVEGRMEASGVTLREGDVITIDGSTGEVMLGEVPLIPGGVTGELRELLEWADSFRRLGVRANADTPEAARKAVEFGAEGIGLARTEHMFFGPKRLPIMQRMIMAQDEAERRGALEELKPMQVSDFLEFFRILDGKPVIIRLLDPPLHEFLPPYEKLLEDALKGDREAKRLLEVVERLRELNPMMGLRGCRLGIVYPEIYEMQVEAIVEAAVKAKREGVKVVPEIMIPLVGFAEELRILRERLMEVAEETMRRLGERVDIKFGTMIEVPRAAVMAHEIAKYADFFSIGTNDLTQMTLGFSRDDAEAKFLKPYMERGILRESPFKTLDEGVKEMVRILVSRGREAKPDLEIGVCGEHGGDPASIHFFHEVGLDYVSASPFRVPVARLAAAQAALRKR